MYCYMETEDRPQSQNEADTKGQHEIKLGGKPNGRFNLRGQCALDDDPASFVRGMTRKNPNRIVFTRELVGHPDFEPPDNREWRNIPYEVLKPHIIPPDELQSAFEDHCQKLKEKKKGGAS